MLAKNLVWLFFCFALSGNTLTTSCKKEKTCKTSRTLGLKTSDCYKMDLKKFPTCLPPNVEVVELSYNRIRKVEYDDLHRYPYITHLYLTDNLISKLDDDIFKDSTSLETLDLSVNALFRVPPSIFQLPTLKTLYLSQNMNINVAESLENAKPILQSTLTKLDISYITEDGYATDFPDFSDLPLLAFVNISGDQFNYLSPRHFAGLCNLQILANSNATAEFENDCDCWKINRWLAERKVVFTDFQCPNNKEGMHLMCNFQNYNVHCYADCIDDQIEFDDLEAFSKCMEKLQNIQFALYLKKVWIWIGVAVILIFFLSIIIVYIKWRKNKQKKRLTKRAKPLIKPPLAIEHKDQFQLMERLND
ncbi:uncharacterized protein LOC109541159 isoform X1 [Dendroctonus ponderosae]|uniref:uncharacterized protein LOC109541159 isoform X1 n=1 Tax=Dendroctonus ponderosae TaxID=77166 RepID=UPI0020350C43|nr:uncharacterized protein LOC109541159 isoform X1 [Dendroctonus ponderosae]